MQLTFIQNPSFFAYFGDASDHLPHADSGCTQEFILLKNKIIQKTNQSSLSLFFLKQTHSADVCILQETPNDHSFFQMQGDAIITTKKNIGIGVITADCIPLFLFDPENKVIAVIHAGWRGLSKKIITETLTQMNSHYKTNLTKLQVYIGPAAGVCCYEVQQDFLENFPTDVFKKKITEIHHNKIFFNAKKMCLSELIENKIALQNIDAHACICTICNPQFCSFRREKENAGRQASIIFLR